MNLYHFDDYLNVVMLHRNNYPLVLDISTPYEQVKMKKIFYLYYLRANLAINCIYLSFSCLCSCCDVALVNFLYVLDLSTTIENNYEAKHAAIYFGEY